MDELLPRDRRVAVVAAHPDDETVGFATCLGRLARAAELRPKVVVVTDGAPFDASLRWVSGERGAYRARRREELACALAAVGIGASDVIWLDVVDQEAAFGLAWIARKLAEIFAQEGIGVVVAHGYEGGHPDHDATAYAVQAAVRLRALSGLHARAPQRVEMFSLPLSEHLSAFDHVVVLDEVERATKARMLGAYASQAGVLAACPLDREWLRRAPTYDFAKPPCREPAHYERQGWSMSVRRFCELAAEAEAALFGPTTATSSEARNAPVVRAPAPPVASRRLSVLSVAHALEPVVPSAGGAEQVLSMLDRALVSAGHDSTVVAVEGSTVAGTLVATPAPRLDEDWGRAWNAHRAAIERVLSERRIDVVHFHGLDFLDVLPERLPPAVATLHLAPSTYGPRLAALRRRGIWLNPVSRWEWRSCGGLPEVLEPIPNGVDFTTLAPPRDPDDFVLFVGRICPDKGVDVAIDVAQALGVPLVIAGPVRPYPAHVAYFEERIEPRLGEMCRHVGPVAGVRKADLLSRARAVLVPSRIPETSSLVAMEAGASGAPVAALDAGAMTEIVEDGVTGAIAPSPDGLRDALARALELPRDACFRAARRRFDARNTARAYMRLYERLARGGPEVRA